MRAGERPPLGLATRIRHLGQVYELEPPPLGGTGFNVNRQGKGTSYVRGVGPSQDPKGKQMVLLLAFLVVLLLFGLGFAVHLLWIAAVVFFIVWLIGFALGRGKAQEAIAFTDGSCDHHCQQDRRCQQAEV